jgi:DNA-binding GntR family transcriptional regulator
MHLSERAYHRLKRMIVRQRLEAGRPLSERTLADALSVSRVPVREAVKALQREGLLMVLPRRGIFVRHLTADEVRELYEVRQAIEGMATYLCAARGCGRQMRAVRRRLEGQLARGKKVDHAEIQRESSRFHRAIFDLCGNSQLRALYRIVEPQIDLNLRFTALYATRRIEQALREHIAIAKAIEAEQPRRAERLTWLHLENGKTARIAILRKQEIARSKPASARGPRAGKPASAARRAAA